MYVNVCLCTACESMFVSVYDVFVIASLFERMFVCVYDGCICVCVCVYVCLCVCVNIKTHACIFVLGCFPHLFVCLFQDNYKLYDLENNDEQNRQFTKKIQSHNERI